MLSEVVLADLACVGFGEPGEEGAYAGVQCDDACLSLAFAPFGFEYDCQVELAVMAGEPAVAMVGGQGFCHVNVAQDSGVDSCGLG